MVRLVQGAGVLVGLGVAADYFRTGSNKDYYFSLVISGGKVEVDKSAHKTRVYQVSPGHVTRFHFTNRPGEGVDFKMYEPHTTSDPECKRRFLFAPRGAKDCESKTIPLGDGDTKQILVKVHPRWNGVDCKEPRTCPSIIAAKRSTETDLREVDPDLQIERDTLLPDWLMVLLAASSVAMIAAPLIRDVLEPGNRRAER